MALKDNLKSKRTEKGLTLDEVATKVGVSRQTIQRYESGVISNIPSDNIEKLASALDTTPAELMGWSGGAVKVTTRMTFDDNSPMHALTQAYLRRPSLVQDEIIRRLEGLDATFSHNISKLLQASGDINGFMQGTGLPFATVGKFMQGETVLTTPAEAERIATYFHTNVVDLFFKDSEAQTKKTPATKDTTLPSPEDMEKSMASSTTSTINNFKQQIQDFPGFKNNAFHASAPSIEDLKILDTAFFRKLYEDQKYDNQHKILPEMFWLPDFIKQLKSAADQYNNIPQQSLGTAKTICSNFRNTISKYNKSPI